MKSGISNSLVVFAVLFFSTVILFPVQSHSGAGDSSARANGFVFSREGGRDYKYRFSFSDPSTLRDRKQMDSLGFISYTKYDLTFANRPWMYCLRWWRQGCYYVCRVDTATGAGIVADMRCTMLSLISSMGLSYSKSDNSLYFINYTDYGGASYVHNYLCQINLSNRGDAVKQVLQFNDTSRFVTFTIGPDGFGYALNLRCELKKLNLSTGSSELVCKLKIRGTVKHGDFNPVSGKLYLLASRDSLLTQLIEVDVKSGKSKIAAEWQGDYFSLVISGNVYPPPLPAPELVSPIGYLKDFPPELVWKPVTGATGYFLNYRMMHDGVGHPWWNWKDVNATTYQLEKNDFETDFNNYWWVAAYDSTGLGWLSPHAVTGSHVDEK